MRILTSLPTRGPWHVNFPDSGHGSHREGLAVEFDPTPSSKKWVGNFQRGMTQFDKVTGNFAPNRQLVIAGGAVYVVDQVTRAQIDMIGGDDILWSSSSKGGSLVLLAGWTDIIAYSMAGIAWTSERISWDGLRNLEVVTGSVTGEAYSPIDDEWHRFELDTTTGRHTGGSW